MENLTKIPMFPLSIFPLPGELVPLHIFEPRYRQLLADAETKDFSFGIYFTHTSNTDKIGSLMKLESVIKRHATGESDIIVKCIDLFHLDKLLRNYRDKLYPGGEVSFWNVDLSEQPTDFLLQAYHDYLGHLKIHQSERIPSSYQIANDLNLDFDERLRFVKYDQAKKENFLLSQLRYHTKLLMQVEKSKDVFHLN
jgi:Lon protease-like protein